MIDTLTPATLLAEGIGKSFRNGRTVTPVLKALSLAVMPGELTLIAGPSGCGKSTLLSILSGLQPPNTGRVRALGQDLAALDARGREHFRLQHVGFVFQGFNLFPALTAWEQVALPLHYLGLSPRKARALACDTLAAVGLAALIDQLPATLSGGEKQRVAIARALAKQPQLLFADEPTSALDAHSGQVVAGILHRTASDNGVTVLCVSHDPRLIGHADRVLEMEDGVIRIDRRAAEAKWCDAPPATSRRPEESASPLAVSHG